jgi:pSer/pThr/pTyr-binding forkhead associated (FHA) protein
VNDVVLDCRDVSKLHARLQRTPEHLVLQDFDSSNGTFVNGARVASALLQDGDVVSLAGLVKYRVKIERVEVRTVVDTRIAHLEKKEEGFAGRADDVPADWETRYEWDSGEYAVLAGARRGLGDGDSPMERTAPPVPALGPLGAPAPATIARVRLEGAEIALAVTEPGTYVIGRLTDVPLRIVHPTISRRQARLTLSADHTSVRLEHTGSSPTLLNGVPFEGAQPLADGDRLRLGDIDVTVRLDRG